MAESGVLYELVTTAGTLRFNDLTQSACFLLSAVNDLESPDVRYATRNKPGRPGVILGNSFKGAITPTIEGVLVFSTLAERQSLQRLLMLHADAMNGVDAQLQWRPKLSDDKRQLTVRLAAKPNIGSGVIKSFQLPMIADDPFIESTSLTQVSTSILNPGTGSGGLSFNLTFPFSFNYTSSPATATITNSGDFAAYPTVRIIGPITNPRLKNLTTGKTLSLITTVPDGQYAEVNMKNETVLMNGVTQMINTLDPTTSEWWPLIPGDNNVQLDGTVAPGVVTVYALFQYRNVYAS